MTGQGIGVVIPAAGSGNRMGLGPGQRKPYLELLGRPLLCWVLDVFAGLEGVGEIVVVGPSEDLERTKAVIGGWRDSVPGGEPGPAPAVGNDAPAVRVVPGGARRQDSVLAGIRALAPELEVVLVHDAARPLVTLAEARAVARAVAEHGAAAVGYPATDSVKEAVGDEAGRGLDRDRVWLVQTPQGAERGLLLRAYEALEGAGNARTDEVAVLETIGVRPRLVRGSRHNIKVTHRGDLELAAFLLGRRRAAPPGAGEALPE